MTEQKLSKLRVLLRYNAKDVMSYIVRNFIQRDQQGKAIKVIDAPICMFCGTSKNITKEHVIPRWVFDKSTSAHFNITLNGQSQTYNKTTIPACNVCNAELLNALERYIQNLFVNGTDFDFYNEHQHIIRWLELIDYKFHILNITKQFLSPREGNHIPYLKDFPLYMLLPNKDLSPSKVGSTIRKALLRLSIKDKSRKVNSLVIFKTTNKGYHFFHTLDDFIFIEIPQYGLAMFYFYNKEFMDIKEAHTAAMQIINKVY
jgi:hypothetical protein